MKVIVVDNSKIAYGKYPLPTLQFLTANPKILNQINLILAKCKNGEE